MKPLFENLQLELGRRTIEQTGISPGVLANLNPALALRPYQVKALQYFITYWEQAFNDKPKQNHQLLFHMATGSGKTLMMAALILYLYEKGYRNFLFFVNSRNIIEKTRGNFLNGESSKFLFSSNIQFGQTHAQIREVANFQSTSPDDINIVFTTIQMLHMTLQNPSENSITEEDFANQKIVFLSDEAHHINAVTKKGAATQEEMFEAISWEQTVEKIFKARPDNALLEFTATMDLSDENLEKKYKPKLIYDYPLKDFRKDGYSKEVKVLQADLPPFLRALQAVILSQYRRKVFEAHKKAIKPVILFKSRTIKESKEFFVAFSDGIQGLGVAQLQGLRVNAQDGPVRKAFDYFDAQGVTLPNLIAELRADFAAGHLIEVNSQEESEAKQIAVNTLEDPSNAYRAVFAVDKLNEGWDVLNLFDIVRLYNIRDSKGGKAGKTTMSEAQLIGRGARYCPFKIDANQPQYERKYDADLDNELRVCEELYYHSALNPKYIQELNSALQEIGIKARETKPRRIKLKESFKETPLYKAGVVFLNERKKYDRSDIVGLESTLINQPHKVTLFTGYTRSSTAFESAAESGGAERKSQEYLLSDLGVHIIRKAIHRLAFYEFTSLQRYLPNLRSLSEFITSEKYLGKVKVEVSGLPKVVVDLSADDKLDAAIQVLERIADVIASDKIEFKGTKEFRPHMVRECFKDKTMNFMLDDGEGDKEFGRSMRNLEETAFYLDLDKRDWYVFDDCFGTSEEKQLIKYIDNRYDELKKKYSDVYLIRNERHFQLFNFDDGRPLEPDFVLYLIGNNAADTMHYQVFIEPKGGHLLTQDKWKEDFLAKIKDSCIVEQLFTGKEYVIFGLPFYSSEQRVKEFTDAFNSEILTPQ